MKRTYIETSRAFDVVAPHYDSVYGVGGNTMMNWMRGQSLKLLEATFPPGSRLLEIGCGTGEEAVALAEACRHVLATDISPNMAALTARRSRDAGLTNRVTALCLPAGDLAALRPRERFDGAYASFGALNCEPRLERLGIALRRLLKPGGAFVCTVMARWCPFEIAWFSLHGQPAIAFRRLRRGWQTAPVAGLEGSEVTVATRYLSLADVRRAFSDGFHIDVAMALPLLLPPPYLDDLYRTRRCLFDRLEAWECRLRTRWPFRRWGDHIALVLRATAD
ncbi:MAG: class I SAM-dependent methyltransferase [Anaerolineae bacterium]|jgi:ubiquinone/menaquinone biosynthesis C-methylase UbiE